MCQVHRLLPRQARSVHVVSSRGRKQQQQQQQQQKEYPETRSCWTACERCSCRCCNCCRDCGWCERREEAAPRSCKLLRGRGEQELSSLPWCCDCCTQRESNSNCERLENNKGWRCCVVGEQPLARARAALPKKTGGRRYDQRPSLRGRVCEIILACSPFISPHFFFSICP